ncbi:hypothetical protein CARUB_v10027487mg [Capsella rubella]|uniref:Uncharacterized protein n=1 Tax=Capsella rubella TaxID=81985 RepID=R0GSY6_9BRAS|nr:hypothetical protein CARUB_v10027487mg [Capsella rubella]
MVLLASGSFTALKDHLNLVELRVSMLYSFSPLHTLLHQMKMLLFRKEDGASSLRYSLLVDLCSLSIRWVLF